MLEPSALQRFFPVVVTPSHDGKFFQNYVMSMMNFAIEAERAGMRMQVLFHQGESLVTRARNNCVAQFLANPEWTHLFWIDADIGFSPQAAFRLLLSDYEIAAGVYPLKREDWPEEGVASGTTRAQFDATFTRYTVNASASEASGKVELEVQPDGFMKMTEAPTGFMAIKRGVFERLMASYPELNYVPDSIGEADRGLHYRFFDVMVDPVTRRYLSEDYGFCRLWSGLGESIHIDANSNLTHQGAKLYRGDFATSLLTSLPHAVGGPAGVSMELTGTQYLRPNHPPTL
ncbi:hypothetical protein SAMN05443579_109160 [Variovorax sp. PDC80]|uniref:hypothetical protein n=1 Tax=Variovorax sp. PDC80 TaxID=1882827 RepID=UPI0008F3E738|nr:hypothetical protein [Variovorax sp. PDC80]SFP19837.1 hypothetical protein SAMN05443579_109160 [Variovorax sp. PDC80]